MANQGLRIGDDFEFWFRVDKFPNLFFITHLLLIGLPIPGLILFPIASFKFVTIQLQVTISLKNLHSKWSDQPLPSCFLSETTLSTPKRQLPVAFYRLTSFK